MLTRIVAAGRDPDTTPVGDVMSTELVVGDVSESYEVCLARMQQAHVRHLIALQDGRLAGIVSLRDVLAADIDEKAEELTMLNAYVHYIPAHMQTQDCAVLEFLVPRHLNGLELRLVRRLRIVVEALEREHAFAQVGEPQRQRIDPRKLLDERDRDIFGVSPLHGLTSSVFRSFLSDLPSWMPPPSCT